MVFGIRIIRSESRQNLERWVLNCELTRDFALIIKSSYHLLEYWVGIKFNGTMNMRKILYFYLPVSSAFFFLSYNKKRAVNMLTANISLSLIGKKSNFFALVAYNSYLFCDSGGRLFYAVQDHGINLRIRVFIHLTKKVR